MGVPILICSFKTLRLLRVLILIADCCCPSFEVLKCFCSVSLGINYNQCERGEREAAISLTCVPAPPNLEFSQKLFNA